MISLCTVVKRKIPPLSPIGHFVMATAAWACLHSCSLGAAHFNSSQGDQFFHFFEEASVSSNYTLQEGAVIRANSGGLPLIRTKDSDYHTQDFLFEFTIQLEESDEHGDTIVVGMGSGRADLEGSVYMSLHPSSSGIIDVASSRYGWQWDSGREAIHPGIHRIRLISQNDELTFQVDTDYGGAFSADYETTVPLTIYGLDESNSRLFFGTVTEGATLSDFSIKRGPRSRVPPALKLIPQPQRVQLSAGKFCITTDVEIILPKNCGDDDRFAVEQLQEEIIAGLNIKLNVADKKKGPRAIVLERLDRNSSIKQVLETKGIPAPDELPSEGYCIAVEPEGIVAVGADAEGLFYGIQTLRQLIRTNADGDAIPCCTITDWPGMKLRGWQCDISRGPIPTMDYLKRQVRTLSQYKLNFLTLYTEHVFRLEKHPTIAPPEGLTAEQVRDLDEYCRRYHVQLAGNFQSFGHTTKIQWTPGYAHLFKGGVHWPWNFDPTNEDVYQFLDDAYQEIAPAYSSPLFFVINCDEVGGMSSETYAKHISRVSELLKPHGKTPMMWGDIALHQEEIIEKLPSDVIFLTWNYYAKNSYESSILPIAEAKRSFLVCPAAWSFGSLLPRFQHSIKNISGFIRDGAKYGATGALCTQWQDAGEELSNANWYLLVWAAENAWMPLAASEEKDESNLRENRLFAFNHAFDSLFYGLDGDRICQAYLRLSRMRYYPFLAPIAQHSDRYVYRGFWCISLRPGVSRPGPLDLIPGDPDQLQQQIRRFLADIDQVTGSLQEARQEASSNVDTIDSILYAARRIRFLGQRLLSRIEIAKAWQSVPENDKDKALAVLGSARGKINALLNEIEEMRVEYVRLWYLENRSWWLPYNHARYDRLRHKIGKALSEVAQAQNNLQNHDQWPDPEKVYLSLLSHKEK